MPSLFVVEVLPCWIQHIETAPGPLLGNELGLENTSSAVAFHSRKVVNCFQAAGTHNRHAWLLDGLNHLHVRKAAPTYFLDELFENAIATFLQVLPTSVGKGPLLSLPKMFGGLADPRDALEVCVLGRRLYEGELVEVHARFVHGHPVHVVSLGGRQALVPDDVAVGHHISAGRESPEPDEIGKFSGIFHRLSVMNWKLHVLRKRWKCMHRGFNTSSSLS